MAVFGCSKKYYRKDGHHFWCGAQGTVFSSGESIGF